MAHREQTDSMEKNTIKKKTVELLVVNKLKSLLVDLYLQSITV